LFTSVNGCAHISHIQALCVEHLPSDATASARAPCNGEYLLWEVRSAGNEHQLCEFSVRENETLGFDADNGSLLAVAGNNRYTLPAGWYRWYRRVPPGETATRAAVSIVIFPFLLAAYGGGP